MSLFSKLFARRPSTRRTAPRTTRLNLECLEAREVPTVTYHGGALLNHVEAQAVYLGSNYAASPYSQQAGQLDTFVKTLVNSPYLDALTQDGYGVGRGSASPGLIDGKQIDGRYYLTDGAVRQELQSLLSHGYLQTPDANRLYVVFVEPGVSVQGPDGGTSVRDFLGYHTAFTGYDANGSAHAIRYAIVTYPGAGTNNGFVPGLNAFDTLTKVASHEIAEAVTDPDVNYANGRLGWYDDQLNGEVGDITNGSVTRFGGYAVQLIADKNDNPTPLPTAASPYETPALNNLAAGYQYGYAEYVYGTHSTYAYYAYVYGYYAHAYAEVAAQTHNAGYWQLAYQYGAAAEANAYADYAATGNVYAYYATTYDYYGYTAAYSAYADERAS
jgi:hypothetical protein